MRLRKLRKLRIRRTALINKYIAENNLKVNESYLFGNSKLSDFVRYNNSKIGVEGGISNYRHMKVTEELNKEINAEQRVALAEKMKHSPMVQLQYVRQLK
jgi:hypothetical protein